jgi:hypothetical protein
MSFTCAVLHLDFILRGPLSCTSDDMNLTSIFLVPNSVSSGMYKLPLASRIKVQPMSSVNISNIISHLNVGLG